jgi:hypothetical protein
MILSTHRTGTADGNDDETRATGRCGHTQGNRISCWVPYSGV